MMRIFVHSALFRLCSAPLFGVLIYLLILLINNTVAGAEALFSSQELYVCMVLALISFESMRGVIVACERWMRNVLLRRRLLVQLSASLLVSLGLITLAITYYFKLIIGFSIAWRELQVFLIIYGITGLLYQVLYFSHFYLLKENSELLEAEQSMREKVEADFSSFKSEINPDLLYESLENLILTLHHNAEDAEEQIDHLATIYRYGLVNRQKELIGLEEELRAVQSLLSLLNVRHDGNIRLSSDVESPESVFLIPGSLLITVDAVVRNTLINRRTPLHFQVYQEDDDYLVVLHGINDRLQHHAESLHTFSRLQRSYTFFSERPFVQVKAGTENYIKFPLVYVASEDTLTETA